LHQPQDLVGALAAAGEPLTHQRELLLTSADADAEFELVTNAIAPIVTQGSGQWVNGSHRREPSLV
jgi:hypothetical protein